MIALLQAELLKLRTTRTFAVIVGTAALLSMGLVAIAASMSVHDDAHSLFTNSSVTYFIVLLGAIGMTGEWRHRTITGTVLAAPDRVRMLAAKVLAYSADAGPCPALPRIADGAELFLCEAALRSLKEDDPEPQSRGHLLPSEAARLAREAEVKRLVLTHIPLPDRGAWALEQAAAEYHGPLEIAESLRTYEV